MSKAVLMQGNEAAVEGAIAAGMRIFAGYPITPSTEIAEQSALRLPQVGGRFIQMEDEISSIAAVLGASVAGVKAMTATSGPGFSLMQENLGYGAMAEIPCVIVDVQRAGPSTGLPTSPAQGDYMQARWGTHGDHPVIALSPSSVLETFYLMVRAFNLSEKYRTPVIFLMDEIVGHMREGVELPNPSSLIINHRRPSFHDGANKQCYYVPEGQLVPAMKPFGRGERYNITGLAHDESGFPTNNTQVAGKLVSRLLAKVEEHTDDIVRVEEYAMEGGHVPPHHRVALPRAAAEGPPAPAEEHPDGGAQPRSDAAGGPARHRRRHPRLLPGEGGRHRHHPRRDPRQTAGNGGLKTCPVI